jgi:hypothetical protein
MKATENFKKTIADKLKEMGEADPLFAATLAKENKNMDDCITYILNAVQKSQCNAFADNEMFAMAVKYYCLEDSELRKDAVMSACEKELNRLSNNVSV